MDVRPFHTARRCNSSLLPIRGDHFSLLLQFKIQLVRVEPTTTFNLGGGTHASGNGVLHDNVDGVRATFRLDPWTDAEWNGFRSNFVRVIRDFWDGKFRLLPTEPWYTRGGTRVASEIDCNLSIELVDTPAAAHQRYFIIKPRETTFRSFVQAGRRRALLTHRDLSERVYSRRVLVGSERHEVDFRQCTALHEFGHTLGLDHVAGRSNRDAAYGTTLEARADIMGGGDQRTTRHARPWIRRLESHLVRRPGHTEFDVRFHARLLALQLITYWDYDERLSVPAAPRAPGGHAAPRH